MIPYEKQRAYDMRCQAEAVERQTETVTVQLSVPVAWFFRDLLGLDGGISGTLGIGTMQDMKNLNAALGEYRSWRPPNGLPEPHVSGWSEKMVKQIRRPR